MAGWRRATALAVTTFGLVGCMSGSSMTPTGPDSAASLVGPTWTLTTIAGQPAIQGTKVTATFSAEDRVSGSAGCNSYFGRARAEAGRLSVGPLGSTLMACVQDSLMQQEGRYLGHLEAATTYTVGGDELRLGPSAAEVTLVFTSR